MWSPSERGSLAYRWRRDVWRIVWLAALVLAARTLFEPVMVPYYVMPGLALSLVAGRRHTLRWLGVCVAGAGLTVMTFTHHGRWEYWLALTGLTAAMLALAWPVQPVREAKDGDLPTSEGGDIPASENENERRHRRCRCSIKRGSVPKLEGDRHRTASPATGPSYWTNSIRSPSLSHSGYSGRWTTPSGDDPPSRPQTGGRIEKMGRPDPPNPLVDDPLDSGHTPVEQGASFVLPCSGVLGEADGLVPVELEEAQLGMHLEDGPLPVGRHLLMDLGGPLEHAPTDGAQASAVDLFGLVVGIAFEGGAHRCGEHRTGAGGAQKGASLTIARASPGRGVVEKPDW